MIFDSDGQAIASFECAAADGNNLYFAEVFGNEIFCYDMETDKVTSLCTIREEDECGKRLFSSMVVYGEDIFLFPFVARGIYRISKQTGDYLVLDLSEKSLEEYEAEYKFIDAHLYRDVIYVMPVAFPGILEVQCSSNKVTVHDSWLDKIPDEFTDIDNSFFRKTLLKDNKIYAPLCKGNILMIFDLEKGECIMKEVGTNKCRFSGICYDKENFWLSPRDNGPIVKWNESNNIWQEYADFPKDYVATSTTGIEIWKNHVMVFPQMANMILSIECADGTVKEWNKEFRGKSVLWYGKTEDLLLFCIAGTADVVMVKENSIKPVKIFHPERLQELYRKQKTATYKKLRNGINAGDVLAEAYSDALEDYCRYVLRSEEISEEFNLEERVGQQIYRKVTS